MKDMENKDFMNNQIGDEELSDVVGGLKEGYKMGGYRYIGHVTQHNGVEGEWYYIVKDDGSSWAYGQMTYTELERMGAIGYVRVHRIKITQASSNYSFTPGECKKFEGDFWTLYKDRVEI